MSSSKGKAKETSSPQESSVSWGTGGHTLGSRPSNAQAFSDRPVGAGGAPVPVIRRRNEPNRPRSPTPDFDEYDEDEMIDIDDDY